MRRGTFLCDRLCCRIGNEVSLTGKGFDADGGESGNRFALWTKSIVTFGGEQIFIRPVEQGFTLALQADGAAVIGVFTSEEEDERDAGEESKDNYGSEKYSPGKSPFLLC